MGKRLSACLGIVILSAWVVVAVLHSFIAFPDWILAVFAVLVLLVNLYTVPPQNAFPALRCKTRMGGWTLLLAVFWFLASAILFGGLFLYPGLSGKVVCAFTFAGMVVFGFRIGRMPYSRKGKFGYAALFFLGIVAAALIFSRGVR